MAGKSRIYQSVIDTVGRISGEEPVIFQRDGHVVVASTKGFGMIKYALPTEFTTWEERASLGRGIPEPEARKYSRPVLLKVKAPGRTSELKGDDPELRYFQPLIMDPDGGGITLGGMEEIVKAHSQLPVDGNVRMVNHNSWYHSHKHGYVADGTSVAPTAGRVMSRDKFLELIEDTEDAIFADMEREFGRLKENDSRVPESLRVYGEHGDRGSIVLPDAFVLTPNIFVSFIRGGEPNMSRVSNRWNRKTELATNPYVKFDLPDSCERDQFSMNVIINSQRISAKDARSYRAEQRRISEETSKELEKIEVTVQAMEPMIAKLNGLHNELFSERTLQRTQIVRA